MNLEIQFGDVQEAEPQVQLRPDRNKHFAVVEVFAPSERDLPVFIDLDAMRDMEEHALSDTSIELGGVMLGGQYEDAAGRPFVVITDNLRARHYEASKGSFKFTHETWEQITRERDEFPDELQMVGWYHTHPGWGVFLSGMDMFICDHFFNRPLDLALVIDPCRQDRGFFQWTAEGEERIRRTGGFYLMASRFRQDELDDFASFLEGRYAMANDPRFRSSPPPVVNISGQQGAWQAVGVLGILFVQCCFLMLLAWRLLLPAPAADTDDGGEELVAVQARLDQLSDQRQTAAEIDAKLKVLDEISSSWPDGPRGLVGRLTEKSLQVEQMQEDLRAHQALRAQVESELASAESALESARYREENLKDRLQAMGKKTQRLTEDYDKKVAEVAALKRQLGETSETVVETDSGTSETETAAGGWTIWLWVAAGVVLGLAAVGGLAASLIRARLEDTEPMEITSGGEESVRPTNSSQESDTAPGEMST